VEANRIRAIGRASTEHAGLGSGCISAGVNSEHVATGTVQPGEEQHLLAHAQIGKTLADAVVEHEPGVGRTLVALSGREMAVEEGRLDPADGL